MARAWRAVLRGLLLVALSAGLAELAFRALHAVHPVFIFPSVSYNRFRPAPGSESYGFPHSSLGLRDVEYAWEKPPGVVRIVAVGDSFAYGVVPYPRNFLTLLEIDLARRHGPVELVNMGIPRLGMPDYYSLLANEGLRLDPDLVLLCFYVGNDFMIFPHTERPPRSYLLAFLRFVFRILPAYEGGEAGPSRYLDAHPTFSPDAYRTVLRRRLQQFHAARPSFAAELPRVLEYLDRIRDLCERHGAALFVAILPDELQVVPEVREDLFWSTPGARMEEFDFELPNRVLRAELERRDVPYVDLLPVFREQASGRTLYKPRDTHWNVAGNRLAADRIGDALAERWRDLP